MRPAFLRRGCGSDYTQHRSIPAICRFCERSVGIRLTLDKLAQFELKLAKLLAHYNLENPDAYYRLVIGGSLDHISYAERLLEAPSP